MQGSLSVVTIEFPKTINELLRACELALKNYHDNYGEAVIMVDFQKTTKIASIGFSILEADVQEFALQKNAPLKFINFPTAFKPSLETRALYYRLSEQDGIQFQG
ncbi:hypothetical protein BGP_3135 [Beggiatoa sp. PS]|nr:hypothetical protein BGP_3135 [Beggiatoa sp. PS]